MHVRAVASTTLLCLIVAAVSGCSNSADPAALVSPSSVPFAEVSRSTTAVSDSRFGSRTPGVVYVTSQGLYYDTFVVKDPLPMQGQFQLLSADGETEFGPGQPGYLGGRWWVDENGNGMQDADDHYFLCPLLPPGRTTREP